MPGCDCTKLQRLQVAQYACCKQAKKSLHYGDALYTTDLTACNLGGSMDPSACLCSGTVGVGPIPIMHYASKDGRSNNAHNYTESNKNASHLQSP